MDPRDDSVAWETRLAGCKDMIAGIVGKLGLPAKADKVTTKMPDCYRAHVKRLSANGLERSRAEVLAVDLIAQPGHTDTCSVASVPF